MLKKIKSLIGAKNEKAQDRSDRAEADLEKPVTNPDLVAAIQKLKSDPSDDVKDTLLYELNRANFLAVLLGEVEVSQAGGGSVLKKGSHLNLLIITDQQGRDYLPLFTDWEALRLHTNRPVSSMVFPAQDAWDWALTTGEFAGAVVNPAKDSLPLDRKLLIFLASSGRTSGNAGSPGGDSGDQARQATGRPGTVDRSRLYRRYRHPAFEHCEFNALQQWREEPNGSEIVFTIPHYGLPQLFLQTVGKTDAFGTAIEFYEFAVQQGGEEPINSVQLEIQGFPAVQWDHAEPTYGIYTRALAIDVGEGIIWIYLKSKQAEFHVESVILEEIKATFSFA